MDTIDLPYEQFKLDNGLTVIVHTDRRAPVVGVAVWYRVGSRNEPKGSSGFAHLFEHLMFNGSANAPGDFFAPLEAMGATAYNGSTNNDYTNYYETVPTGALERILFLESDRMGWLLGGVDQEKLDNQRSVVKNEKRQDDNQPFGTVQYLINNAIFPEGHPYRHPVIGSMADLDAARLGDVQHWFKAQYGPNNAVLVLSGDIDVPTARVMAERYFGPIPRGPQTSPPPAPVPRLKRAIPLTLYDGVPNVRLQRVWPVPGPLNPVSPALQVGASVLGGIMASRLDNALVRGDGDALSVTAGIDTMRDVGLFEVTANVRPGRDPDKVNAAIDAIIVRLLRDGPTEDEITQAVMRNAAGMVEAMDAVGGDGRASLLAQGWLNADDPSFALKRLRDYARQTPQSVRRALRQWIARPALRLTILPGERDQSAAMRAIIGADSAETMATTGSGRATGPDAAPGSPEAPAEQRAMRDLPPLGDMATVRFPAIERTQLSNGIPVVFARSGTMPQVNINISFDAGMASDPVAQAGLQQLTFSLLTEGTTRRDSAHIAADLDRLGVNLNAYAGAERSSINMVALTGDTLAPALDLLAEVTKSPRFAPDDLARIRAQMLGAIRNMRSQPENIADIRGVALAYGADHPFARDGLIDDSTLSGITAETVAAHYRRWVRPENARIFIVGNIDLATILPMLEARFGGWAPPADPRGRQDFGPMVQAPTKGRTILIDRPDSVQSALFGISPLSLTGHDDLVPLVRANEILGGSFLSRLNMHLREDKGWTYGVDSSILPREHQINFEVSTSVQTDRTADSLGVLNRDIADFLGPQGVTPAEFRRTIDGATYRLPGLFATIDGVMSGMQQIEFLGRPDNYYDALARRYRSMTAAELDTALRRQLSDRRIDWVIVGDAAKVAPQLDAAGIRYQEQVVPDAR